MAEQLTFDLPVKPALGREDFFVSRANAVAVATLEGWRDWPMGKLVLTGEAGSGKTHLAHVWAQDANARIVSADDLAGEEIGILASGPAAVEDADKIGGLPEAEEALFHLHNLLQAGGHSLLLTARKPPAAWSLGLPDLASRMQGTPLARLDPPDDALLGAVMLKLFADRQLQVPPSLLPYLLRRIDRSFEAARATVEALDRAALSRNRAVTRALAASVLDNSAGSGA